MKKLFFLIATLAMASTAGAVDWSYTVDPSQGDVTEIGAISIKFGSVDEVDFASKSAITLECDGESTGISVKLADNQTVLVTPDEPLTQEGNYVLNIPANTLIGYVFSKTGVLLEEEDNPDDMKFSWNIKGNGSQTGIDFKYQSSLSNEGYLAYFGEVSLEFTEVETISYAGQGISVNKDGEPLEGVSIKTDSNKLIISLKEPLNFIDATIDVIIAPGSLTATSGTATASNGKEIKVTYVMATPVEYNLTAAISTPKPNANGQISADRDLASIFFVCEQPDLVAAGGTEINVTIKSEEEDFEANAHLKKANGLNKNYSYFTADFIKQPSFNGKYLITINRGAFGTSVWSKDPNYGHSNDDIELRFELIDGKDRDVYSITPVAISPEEGTYEKGSDISKVTLTFEAGVAAVTQASATLAGIDNSYRVTATFKKNSTGGYEVTFNPAPDEYGKYLFTVPAGVFGDSDFVASGTGKANPPIALSYTISVDSGVEDALLMDAGSDDMIYNFGGVRVNSKKDQLPAGFYIINGKKVLIGK